MTDAPKIDTQAPDASSKMPPRIWATYYADHPGTAGLWDHIKRYEWEDRVEYERRDLADARAAAAWIAGRDRSADEVDAWNISGDEIRAMIPPADASAALDRLIAERVLPQITAQELFDAFRDSENIAPSGTWVSGEPESTTIDGEVNMQALADWINARARGSKEGRDG